VLGLVGFQQSSNAKSLQQELTKIQQDKQRYTKILAQIKKLEKDKALLEKRIGIIGKLKADSSLTVHVLDEVANITPTKRMWITSLSQSGGSLSLNGIALDNRTIAKYMEDLKQSPYITSVNLANSSLKAFSGRNLKSFSLSCAVSVPAEKVEEK
jgi:type IV pilus assembly protein PilN